MLLFHLLIIHNFMINQDLGSVRCWRLYPGELKDQQEGKSC